YSDRSLSAGAAREPVNRRQNFLHFVANDVPAHMKRLTVDPFAVSLISLTEVRMARPAVPAVDQDRNQHFESALCQSARGLAFRRQTARKTSELFRSLAGIRQNYH